MISRWTTTTRSGSSAAAAAAGRCLPPRSETAAVKLEVAVLERMRDRRDPRQPGGGGCARSRLMRTSRLRSLPCDRVSAARDRPQPQQSGGWSPPLLCLPCRNHRLHMVGGGAGVADSRAYSPCGAEAVAASAVAEDDALWLAVRRPHRRRVLDSFLAGRGEHHDARGGPAGGAAHRLEAHLSVLEPGGPGRGPAQRPQGSAVPVQPELEQRRRDGSRDRPVGPAPGADQAAGRVRRGRHQRSNTDKEKAMTRHRTGTP